MILGAQQDRAIEHEADDRLDRSPFVSNLARALVQDEVDLTGKVVGRRATGVVVGLTGPWGSGKSSVLNLLAQRLEELDHVNVALFNPWLFKGREELLAAFFSQLRDALGRTTGEQGRELVTAMAKYEWAVRGAAFTGALAIDLHGGGGTATATTHSVLGALKKIKALDLISKSKVPKLQVRSPQEERRALEAKLQNTKTAVVVLIDELDRVDDEDVRAVAQLIKAVGDIKGISYLVAYDPVRVADALGRGQGADRARTGEAYLEKIVQHTIPLRPLFADDVEALLNAMLEANGVSLGKIVDANETMVLDQLRTEISTPREIKRLVGSYAVLEPMVRGEISNVDVLAYAWLLSKSGVLREELARQIDQIVDDPTIESRLARSRQSRDKKVTSPVDILGDAAQPYETLLGILFPRFGRGRMGYAGTRISRRRNLVRLLYLGNPPGMASRQDVEQLWSMGDHHALVETLRTLARDDRLQTIMDRLDDLMPHLDKVHEGKFWLALAKALVRETDWLERPEANEAIADDAATYLMRLGDIDRIKKIISTLEAEEDLVLAPILLRKHLFIHGLTRHDNRRSDGGALNESETRAMLDRAIPIYRKSIIDGNLLKRNPNVEALFVLSNVNAWDEELRSSLTEQMKMPEARATFAGLVTPPGQMIDAATLDELMDAQSVRDRIAAEGDGEPEDSWLNVSIARLGRMLKGEYRLGS